MLNIKEQFQLLATTRQNILNEIEACTPQQLFKIPAGFNNNIIWNATHLLATQQVLIYAKSNTPFSIDESLVIEFRKGTTPSEEVNEELIELVKNLFLASLEQTKTDYENKIFGTYESVTTSYGVTLNSVEDAICFSNLHESMHYGQIKMLRKLI